MKNTIEEMRSSAMAALSHDDANALWYQANAQAAAAYGYTPEGFSAFAAGMLFEGAEAPFRVPARHHMDWVRAVMSHRNVLILCPPESGKTTILSVLFTAFTIGHFPHLQNMIVSVSDAQAEDIAGIIALYIEFHPFWKLVFPRVVPDKKRGWGVGKGWFVREKGNYAAWTLKRGTRKDPTLVGVGYSNRSIIGKRVDGLFMVDDMMDENNTRSDTELEYAKDVFTKTISSRPTKRARLVLVGTPWREDDVYAGAAKGGLYHTIITPAAKVKDGKLIDSYWPEEWPIERLERRRQEMANERGDRAFQLMYLMNLEASKGQLLEPHWLVPKFPAIQILPEWPRVLGIDFAMTSGDVGLKGPSGKRSYFSIAEIAMGPTCCVVVDGVLEHVSLERAIELTKRWIESKRPTKTVIEAWGTGEVFYQQLERELRSANLERVRDTKDKPYRFLAMSRHFEAGRVRLSDADYPFLRAVEDEWARAPSEPNDALDAITNAIHAAGFRIYQGENLAVIRDNPELLLDIMQGPKQFSMPGSSFAPSGRQSHGRVPYPKET